MRWSVPQFPNLKLSQASGRSFSTHWPHISQPKTQPAQQQVTEDTAVAVSETTETVTEILARLKRLEKEVVSLRMQRSSGSSSTVSKKTFIITESSTTKGAAVGGGVIGGILGWSVLVNLWLLGMFIGATSCAYLSTTESSLGRIAKLIGTQVALVWKDIYDFYKQTTYLYRTGKLSYKYWTIWEEYDK